MRRSTRSVRSRALDVHAADTLLKEDSVRARVLAMAASLPAPAAAEVKKDCRSYQFKLSEQGLTEAEVAAATEQAAALDERKKASLKASIRHYLSHNPSEVMRQASATIRCSRCGWRTPREIESRDRGYVSVSCR